MHQFVEVKITKSVALYLRAKNVLLYHFVETLKFEFPVILNVGKVGAVRLANNKGMERIKCLGGRA